MKTPTKTSASAKTRQTTSEAPSVKLEDAQRTIRIPGMVDTALIQLQVKRRLEGKKCPTINGLIAEAIEGLLIAEGLYPLSATK